MYKENQIVVSKRNISSNVYVGCKGVIVFVYSKPKEAYEVEFVDDNGKSIEIITVMREDIDLI